MSLQARIGSASSVDEPVHVVVEKVVAGDLADLGDAVADDAAVVDLVDLAVPVVVEAVVAVGLGRDAAAERDEPDHRQHPGNTPTQNPHGQLSQL